jgi:hypothetical protein
VPTTSAQPRPGRGGDPIPHRIRTDRRLTVSRKRVGSDDALIAEFEDQVLYIRHLTVKNWLIHKNTSVDLFPVTVFVGPNNGGKSALFELVICKQGNPHHYQSVQVKGARILAAHHSQPCTIRHKLSLNC